MHMLDDIVYGFLSIEPLLIPIAQPFSGFYPQYFKKYFSPFSSRTSIFRESNHAFKTIFPARRNIGGSTLPTGIVTTTVDKCLLFPSARPIRPGAMCIKIKNKTHFLPFSPLTAVSSIFRIRLGSAIMLCYLAEHAFIRLDVIWMICLTFI